MIIKYIKLHYRFLIKKVILLLLIMLYNNLLTPRCTFIFIILCFFFEIECLAQDKGFYLGSNLSMIYEQRSARIYGSGYEERTSKTADIGLGVRAIYKTKKAKFGSGLSYVNRNYKMTRPFDHCLFNKPGDLCLKYLGYVDQYNYQTIEIPLTFDLTVYKKIELNILLGQLIRMHFISNLIIKPICPI